MRCCHSSSRAGIGFRRADSGLKLGLTLRRLCTQSVWRQSCNVRFRGADDFLD